MKERGKGGLFLLTCSVSRLTLPSRKTEKPCVRSVFLCVVELLACFADSHDLKSSSKVPKSHPRFTEGIFTWGIGNKTDEHSDGSGHKIIHARTIRRRHDSEKWKIEKVESLKVGPLQTDTRAREEEEADHIPKLDNEPKGGIIQEEGIVQPQESRRMQAAFINIRSEPREALVGYLEVKVCEERHVTVEGVEEFVYLH